MDLANYSIYGNAQNTSAIPADLLNTNADGSTDWNMVLSQGIRGAAQGAISALVGEKYADGQLVAQQRAAAQSSSMSNLLLIGVIAYVFLH